MNLTKTEVTSIKERLSDLFNFNEDFKIELLQLVNFYSQKFHNIIKKEDKRKEFDEILFEAIKSQFYQGYDLFHNILKDENSEFPNEYFEQAEGYVKESVPEIILEALGENTDNVIRTQQSQRLITWAIGEYEGIYDTLKQTVFDITCIGALQAVKDEAYARGIDNKFEPLEGWLTTLNNLDFLTPQIFLTAVVKNERVEMWELQWWSALSKLSKAGDVSIIQISQTDEGVEQLSYLLNIQMVEEIAETERNRIAEYLFLKLRGNLPQEYTIIPNISVVKEYYFFE